MRGLGARQSRARCTVKAQAHNPAAGALPAGLSRRELLGAAGVALGTTQLPSPSAAAVLELTATAIPTAQLGPASSGLQVSRVLKGCWQLSGGHRGDPASDRTRGKAALEDFGRFYAAGVTSWDCADHYGPAESLIGQYLKDHPQQRSSIQVLTKTCVFSEVEMATLNAGSIEKAVNTSLQRLGTPPEVIQFYWGSYRFPRYTDALKYMGDLQANGSMRGIGVTNFNTRTLQELVDTGVPIVSNQLQYSLLDTRPVAGGMSALCAQRGISLLPYGVLAGGLLSDTYRGIPAKDVRADTFSKGKYSQIIGQAGGWTWFQDLLEALHEVGQRHGQGVSNVAARWVLQQPGVAGVILGARNANHLQDHAALFTFDLDAADLATIQGVLDAGRRPTSDCYDFERGLSAW